MSDGSVPESEDPLSSLWLRSELSESVKEDCRSGEDMVESLGVPIANPPASVEVRLYRGRSRRRRPAPTWQALCCLCARHHLPEDLAVDDKGVHLDTFEREPCADVPA